ncbi:unnamed protein product, partial [Discosporangium mesarthrocarpum]
MALGFSSLVDCLVSVVAPRRAICTIVLLPSAADLLPFPFGALAQTPQITLFLAVGGYLVFLILFLPLYFLSYVLGVGGAWMVLLGG